MRGYAKFGPTFWTGETGKAIRRRGSDALLVAAYLISSPHSNMLGLYYQPVLYMAHETGLGIDGATKGLAACIECGFCSYDESTEMIWVHEMAAWQIADELSPGDKRCKGIQKDYEALPENPFLDAWLDRYINAFHLSKRREKAEPTIVSDKGLGMPHRSQEQEQEQEQKQYSPSLRSGEVAATQASQPNPSATSKKREQVTLSAYLSACKADDAKPVPDDHHIRSWAADAGITDEMLQVTWVVFRDRYTKDVNYKNKRYKDWPGHFANGVQANWFRIWFVGDDGKPAWSSVGMTHKSVLDSRMEQREGHHAGA